MKWICGVWACLACAQALAGPSEGPTTRAAELVPLEVRLPKMGYDGEWMIFHRWRRDRPDAENCTEKLERFLVPRGTRNLALHRPVTSSDNKPVIGKLEQITDGEKEGIEDNMVELRPGLQWVQIDPGRVQRLHAILAWHHAAFPGLHNDVIVQISNDEQFKEGVQTIFNNDRDNSSGMGRGTDREYFEALGTKVIDARNLAARYVRLYSNGNIQDKTNRYIEVEVYGTLAGDEGGSSGRRGNGRPEQERPASQPATRPVGGG